MSEPLTRREAWILLARYGMVDGERRTYAECARDIPQEVVGTPDYRPTRERLRQIEAHAIWKLVHIAEHGEGS